MIRLLVAIGLITSAGEASAQVVVQSRSVAVNAGCLPNFNYTAAPAAQVVQPVVANQNIYVQKVVAQEVAVAPLIVTVPVESKAVAVQAYAPQYYYSAGDAYAQKAMLRDIIREELRNYAGQGQEQRQPPQNFQQPRGLPPQQQQQEPPQHMQNQPPPVQRPPVAIPPGGNGTFPPQTQGPAQPDDTTPAELQQQVLAAFNGKGGCINCHGAGEKLGGGLRLALDDGRLAKLSNDKRWKIYAMSSVGAMPPAAANDASKAMESQHLPALLKWAAIK